MDATMTTTWSSWMNDTGVSDGVGNVSFTTAPDPDYTPWFLIVLGYFVQVTRPVIELLRPVFL